ncbi:MAG: DUF3303 family protein [Acidobacteriaceae bacterium]|jgi:hypothetical protein
MLFMVIESFKSGDARPVGERFRRRGRMMPQGLTYHASWVDVAGQRCFQLMEGTDEAALREWIANWSDLVVFEVIPVMTSVQFWAETELGGAA